MTAPNPAVAHQSLQPQLKLDAPFVNSSGRMTPPWNRLFLYLWQVTGSGQIPQASSLQLTSANGTPAIQNNQGQIIIPILITGVDGNFAITPAGVLELASIGDGDLIGNISGADAEPGPTGLSPLLDHVFGSTEGQLLQRGPVGWQALAPGTLHQLLESGGPAGLNNWTGISALLDVVFGSTEGDILQRGPSVWQILSPGTINQILQSGGAGALNSWTGLSNLLDTVFGSTEGDILQRGPSAWQVLAPGIVGQSLLSGGAGALNSWGNIEEIDGHPVGPNSWTPTDVSGASLTFSAVSANYTRLGNMVFAYGTVTYPATADASNARIGGLPFTSANAGYGNIPVGMRNNTGTIAVEGLVVQNSTQINLFNAVTNALVTNATLSGIQLRWNAIYPVA